uniref:Glyoxysomal processing protease glyoxysomal-like isoform X3 n=1 Tax=Rhizophora mucronata TaxID=61149 RepID=A0A2P2KDB6_RHIMU
MGLPEVVDFARNFAVMVKVHGPDPKGLKMRNHAFHQYNSGKTTLSASGMLLPDTLYDADAANGALRSSIRDLGLVLTVASVVEPFLSQQHREGNSQGRPQLIPGAQIDVMLEGRLKSEKHVTGGVEEAPFWISAQLIRLVDVPVSSIAVQSILEASSSSQDHGWEVGWSLAAQDNGSQPFKDVLKMQREHGNMSLVEGHRHLPMDVTNNPSLMGKSTTRIAILGVCLHSKDLPAISIPFSIQRGDSLLVMGSPFGVLSPVHFFNSMSAGSITNRHPTGASNMSLLMADIRCLPGIEGGPVFGENAHFIGLLIRPLRQKSVGVEIQLVIPWEAIASACSDLLLKVPQTAETGIHINEENLNNVGNIDCHGSDGSSCSKYKHLNSYCSTWPPVEKSMSSICLVTVDEGVWASGVVLNYQGLILTNAHLLEPWRFGKTTVSGGRDEMEPDFHSFHSERSAVPIISYVNGRQKGQNLPPESMKVMDSSLASESKEYKFDLSYKGRRHIRVRLDHANHWTWYDAKLVYVSKGPLDVALLQIECVADQLCPINVDFGWPSLGSRACVVGHGLFGPRCGFFPSVCSGVVAKIVKAKASLCRQSIEGGDMHVPAMLETTAAVYPGGSGGAVINSEGLMIGLVTRYY